ncbi:AGE family epimerase/isomerase [Arcanobacterium bovis]|uniref:AGE family epimerase/isomerase n=1 Tax=Arcanobacterium bovis TaxID=2529275 RepID=A0A4Q9V282_9ACTO|nr:AGE family epimerase/isomerase [Arcanobacterium bovis]TBW23749.1 AGE family epimerase/isomerase [Arcanobacterium bovis]
MFVTEETKEWLNAETSALVDFARKSRVDVGFGTLDADGGIDAAAGAQLWINCRMTHVFCLAYMRGDDSARDYAKHGIRSLLTNFRDSEYDGFFSTISLESGDPLGERGSQKEAYAHAFVLLAASSGIQAGIEGAEELFAAAKDVHEKYFWESVGLACESWDRAFTENEPYRGVNANMHTVEASLAAWEATGDLVWLGKAYSILHFVLGEAKGLGWRIPEHFDTQWNLLPDFNIDQPADPFRPYGITPGHGIEWSRLALQFWVTAQNISADQLREIQADDAWLAEIPQVAVALYDQALADGWDVDGAPGIVYTTSYTGEPVVHERMHWTVCEGIAAAAAFATYGESTGDSELVSRMNERFEELLDFALAKIIEAPGRWTHELDRNNVPSGITWPGKPDVYHAYQCLLMPIIPLTASFAQAVKR